MLMLLPIFPQVFDGHGGVAAAEFASSVLLEYICEHSHFLSDPQSAMVSAAPFVQNAIFSTYLYLAHTLWMLSRHSLPSHSISFPSGA